MNRFLNFLVWIFLLMFSSCAISRKENERIIEQLSQQSKLEEIPVADSLSPEILRKYETRAIQKLNDFYDYLELLKDDNYGIDMKDEIMISTQGLFYNPDIKMNPLAVQGAKRFPLKICLENQTERSLQGLSLGEIKINDALSSIDTNHFQGSISYSLIFGKDAEQTKYVKQANFSLRKIEKKIGNDSVEIWEIFLEGID